MAFSTTASKLQKASGGAKSIFTFETADAIATVVGSGYFNAATDNLKKWDIIHVIATTGGTPTFDSIFVTSATGAATVTTSALEGVTAS